MKNLMMPIETICHFDTEGRITPYRFRYYKDGANIISVDGVIHRDENTFAGNLIHVFYCISHKGDEEITFELKYECKKNIWFLTKI